MQRDIAFVIVGFGVEALALGLGVAGVLTPEAGWYIAAIGVLLIVSPLWFERETIRLWCRYWSFILSDQLVLEREESGNEVCGGPLIESKLYKLTLSHHVSIVDLTVQIVSIDPPIAHFTPHLPLSLTVGEAQRKRGYGGVYYWEHPIWIISAQRIEHEQIRSELGHSIDGLTKEIPIGRYTFEVAVRINGTSTWHTTRTWIYYDATNF